MVLQTLFKEGLKKASALKMAPHIANNIRRKIIEQEKAWIHPQKLGARADCGNKSVRVSVEVPSESSVDNVVKQYSHLNPKPYTNKKGRSSVTVDAPYEHVKYNPNKLGGNRYLIKEDPYIRQQYPFSSPMSDEFVSKNIDTPFLQQLIDEYVEAGKLKILKKIGEHAGKFYPKTQNKILRDSEGLICQTL